MTNLYSPSLLFLLPCLALALTACGGEAETNDQSSGAGGNGTSSGGISGSSGGADGNSGGGSSSGGSTSNGGGTSSGGGSSVGPCPSGTPTSGDSCDKDGAVCSYGDDPRWECRTVATCGAGAWDVASPPVSCDIPPLPPECPSSPATGACTAPPDQCVYSDGTVCLCTDCHPNAPLCGPADPTWACLPAPDGCPASPPNLGTACNEPEGTVCAYTCSNRIGCNGGAWERLEEQCPQCAAPNTLIDTPHGARAISDLKVGDTVYSLRSGQRVAVIVLETAQAPQKNHYVAEIVLASGAILQVSAAHPTADGRTLGELTPGEQLGTSSIVSLSLVPYPYAFTYDVRTSAPDGSYIASGLPLGSTIQ